MTSIDRTTPRVDLNFQAANIKLFSDTLNTNPPTPNQQKVAIAPAIAWYAMNAVWINPLVYAACAGLGAWAIHNIFKILKDEPLESLTATQKVELNNALGTIVQDKRFDTAPTEIKQRLNISFGTDAQVTFKTLFNQALQKSLSSSTLTQKQRDDLIALKSYVFKAETEANSEGAGRTEGETGATQQNDAKKPIKLKKPKKPKLPKVSNRIVKELTNTPNNGGYMFQFKDLFSNPQALPMLKNMLASAKSGFTRNMGAAYISNLEKFIQLAERNFFSGRLPNKSQVMDMAALAKLIGLH